MRARHAQLPRAFAYSLAIVCLTTHARATSLEYHPDCQARLGYGFNPKTPGQIYARQCLPADGDENIDNKQGVASGSITIRQVQDLKTLLSTVGISAAAEARVGLYSGSTSFSSKTQVSFDSSSLVWVATTTVNYG